MLSEALFVADKSRVKFNFGQLYQIVVAEREFEIVGFGTEIFEEVIKVQGVTDIHDRIIVATARFFGSGILTKDRIILESGEYED